MAGDRSGTVELSDSESLIVSELVAREKKLKGQAKWLDLELSTIKNKIRHSLGSSLCIIAGEVTVKASKRAGRSSFDDKSLKEEHPEIHSKFVRPGHPYTVVTKSKTKVKKAKT